MIIEKFVFIQKIYNFNYSLKIYFIKLNINFIIIY
jgi:hypothetical protein